MRMPPEPRQWRWAAARLVRLPPREALAEPQSAFRFAMVPGVGPRQRLADAKAELTAQRSNSWARPAAAPSAYQRRHLKLPGPSRAISFQAQAAVLLHRPHETALAARSALATPYLLPLEAAARPAAALKQPAPTRLVRRTVASDSPAQAPLRGRLVSQRQPESFLLLAEPPVLRVVRAERKPRTVLLAPP